MWVTPCLYPSSLQQRASTAIQRILSSLSQPQDGLIHVCPWKKKGGGAVRMQLPHFPRSPQSPQSNLQIMGIYSCDVSCCQAESRLRETLRDVMGNCFPETGNQIHTMRAVACENPEESHG